MWPVTQWRAGLICFAVWQYQGSKTTLHRGWFLQEQTFEKEVDLTLQILEITSTIAYWSNQVIKASLRRGTSQKED